MKQFFKQFFLSLLVGLVAIQFFKPEKNINKTPSEKYISAVINVPENVNGILIKSCADCHSNNTQYPWYANTQPIAWWLNHHIKEGKAELNIDSFANYSLRRQYRKLEEIMDEVEEDEMPLSSYTLIHRVAKLSETDREVLINWAKETRMEMKQKYPLDSLIKKK